jgi:hypothetical protein
MFINRMLSLSKCRYLKVRPWQTFSFLFSERFDRGIADILIPTFAGMTKSPSHYIHLSFFLS